MSKARITWTLVGLGFFTMFLSSALKGVFQVYFSDLAQSFGRGRADFGFAGGLFLLVSGLASPLVGALSDRAGPIKTVMLGSLTGGIAFVLLAWFSGQYWLFVALYGLVAAFALAAMSYVPMGVLVDRLFEQKKKSFAYAVISNGTSVGFIVLSPLWLWLQPQFSWQQIFMVIGALFAGPVTLLLWWASRIPMPEKPVAEHKQEGNWRSVLSDQGFYVLALGFIGCGATMAFIDIHLVPLWQDGGASRAGMGFSLSLLGILELISGLAAGWLATRYAQQNLLGLFYLMRCLAMALLLVQNSLVTTYLFAAIFGASYLGTVVLTSAICLERYGNQVKGQVFGVLFLLHQAGGFASAQLGAYGYDLFHSYRPTIIVLTLITAIAGLACFLFFTESKHQPAAEPA